MLNLSENKKKIIYGIIAIVYMIALVFLVQFQCSIKELKKEKDQLLKQLTKIEPLENLNKEISFQLIQKENEIEKLINDTIALKKIINVNNEKIKIIADLKKNTEINDIEIPLKKVTDTVKQVILIKNKFDSINEWFQIKGEVKDSTYIDFEKIKFKDDLQFIITQKNDEWNRGYIYNRNPYSTNDQLQIYVENLNRTKWNWTSFGIGAGAVLTAIVTILLVK